MPLVKTLTELAELVVLLGEVVHRSTAVATIWVKFLHYFPCVCVCKRGGKRDWSQSIEWLWSTECKMALCNRVVCWRAGETNMWSGVFSSGRLVARVHFRSGVFSAKRAEQLHHVHYLDGAVRFECTIFVCVCVLSLLASGCQILAGEHREEFRATFCAPFAIGNSCDC